MATIVQQYELPSIFRYKFSESFMDLLRLFANNHRFDEPAVFKERWMRWTCNELNFQKIIKEEKRLVESGYKGNMEDKMYKTVRYYLKTKSPQKKEPKKRRKYVSITRDMIKSMDDHIEEIAIPENMKPSNAYNNFMSIPETSNLIDNEVNELIRKELTEVAALNKIKKTYKNRFYLKQKN